MKYYAIGMKSWAEIREASKPPRPVTTSAEREFEGFDVVYQPDSLGRMMPRKVPRPRKYTLSQTSYVGGKVLGCVPLIIVRAFAGKSLADGGLVELTKDQKASLLERAW
jgi:hypothetical protein